jgi:hypothetical protein
MEVGMAPFEAIPQHLPGGSEKDHGNLKIASL